MQYEYRVEPIANGWLLHIEQPVYREGVIESPKFYKTEAQAFEALYGLVSKRRNELNSDMHPEVKK